MAKKKGKTEEIRPLDEKDRRILNILSENSRTKLTVIARQVGLSVDSTKKRMQKLEKENVIRKYTIQADDPELRLAIHIYVKLKEVNKERYEQFLEEMKKNPRCIDLMSVLGDYDLYIVLIGKNPQDLDRMKLEIKQRFSDILGDWKEVLVTKIYKLEEYRF
ncbi:MAG: Lrp/AsnC family transcriptional regulator [Candidatus Aenigmarchaeota archaeon]|nr:Lrp/AsnC family transcriptional regulator [Candidatus Aenigmarchaeota archaeon]